MYLLNKMFWIASAERAIKTFVQALIAAFGVGQVSGAVGVDVAAIDWRGALSLAFSAALLSVLMSVGSGPIGAANSPSLLTAAPAAAATALVAAAAASPVLAPAVAAATAATEPAPATAPVPAEPAPAPAAA
ncbi:holin [Catellatospora citrea]|uniref:holin n=1 Tax=Catellatospora citrea TaxID=53366 RepID=UPI0033D4AD13